jgi:hypothetical protein
MSWSLQVHNGDLVLLGTTLSTVKGPNKLAQDLRCAILERMGTDESHPWFGSLVDGGISNGMMVPGLIGTNDIGEAALEIEAEIRRIAEIYQQQQLQRLESDRLTYGKSTLDSGELLMGVNNVQIMQAEDRLLVTASIRTGNDTDVDLDFALGV